MNDVPRPRICAGRWLLGGLAAGAILTVAGATFAHVILGPEFEKAFHDRMASPPGPGTVALHIGMRMGFGLLAVFLYAAIRPRFGPGPKTALIAGGLLWLLSYVPLSISLLQHGIASESQFAVILAWGLGEAWIATLAGGWIYREGG